MYINQAFCSLKFNFFHDNEYFIYIKNQTILVTLNFSFKVNKVYT